MRRAVKRGDSPIVARRLQYLSGNSTNNKKIAELLFDEQKGFCAYTDEYISRTDARDIEHFDPTIKGSPGDGYQNWFLVKHQWNKEKSEKWDEFQPVLHPTAHDFEERVIYLSGDYMAESVHDSEAVNVVKLLKLDDPALAEKRRRYIKRKRAEMDAYGHDPVTFFTDLLEADHCQVSYLRAIKVEFGIDLWPLLT